MLLQCFFITEFNKLNFLVLVGVIIGSTVLKRFPLKDVCKKSAFFIFLLRTVGFISPLSFLIVGCNNIHLAGVTTPYNQM